MKRELFILAMAASSLVAGCTVPVIADVPADVDETENVEVRWVRMPVLLQERVENGCDDLDLSLLEVTEDGAPVLLRRVEKQRMETVHAILMDTSPSMKNRRRLEEAAAAARNYIESLPAGEPVIMATFDESLVFRGCNAEDAAALAQLETGWRTMLWDSIDQMIAYLRTRSERIVLVVISDGCETQGADGPRPADVIETASQTENLTVFTIGINLGRRCYNTLVPSDPSIHLTQLAGGTGGRFYQIRTARELSSTLPEIRARLDMEGYVVYEPPPFGSGPMDRPGQKNYRWRKVRIDNKGKTPCKVSLAGASRRLENAGEVSAEVVPFRDGGGVVPPGDGSAGWTVYTGTVTDTVEDSSILYNPESYRRHGRYRFREVAGSRTETREVRIPVPPLRGLLGDDGSAAGVLLNAMRATGDKVNVGRWTELPFLVNGRTFLKLRARLAKTLFGAPGYGDWAYRKIRDERLASIDAMSGAALAEQEGENHLEQLREHVRTLAWEPKTDELQRYLASWLGDVRAIDLVEAAEIRLAGMFLAGGDTGGFEELWPSLQVWFPPPLEVRQLAMLLPGYSRDRDVIGFYRVLLPRLRANRPPTDLVPGQPLGLRLLRWMRGRENLAPLFERGITLQDIDYTRPKRREISEVRRRLEEKGHEPPGVDVLAAYQVTIVLAPPDSSGAGLSVGAYYARPGDEAPACLVLPGGDRVAGPPDEMARWLERLIREQLPRRIE